MITPARIFFSSLLVINTYVLNINNALGHTAISDVRSSSYKVAGFGDWLDKQMNKILRLDEQPTRYNNQESHTTVDLQQEKETNEAQAESNRRKCTSEYNSMMSNYGYGNSIVKDGKIWMISDWCDGKRTRPRYEYQGELGQVMRSNCGDLTQYKLLDGRLCMFFRGHGSETIEKSCDNKN